jgi:hypothetical protein
MSKGGKRYDGVVAPVHEIAVHSVQLANSARHVAEVLIVSDSKHDSCARRNLKNAQKRRKVRPARFPIMPFGKHMIWNLTPCTHLYTQKNLRSASINST